MTFDEFVDDVNKEVGIREALKLSIFVVQKASAPKKGVEFRQGSNDTIRSSLDTSYDVSRRRATALISVYSDGRTDKQTRLWRSHHDLKTGGKDRGGNK